MAPAASAPPAVLDPDPYRVEALALVTLFSLVIPLIVGVIALTVPEPEPDPWLAWGEQLGVPVADLSRGRLIFANACALCHGDDGEGVARLGKPLRNSAYVQAHTDAELVSLIQEGRLPGDPENTTGVAMPARAGRDDLDEDRLYNVVSFLRTLQEPGVPPVSIEDWILATTPAGGEASSTDIVGSESSIGHDAFVASCSACHGSAGEGVPGLGKALSGSPFVAEKSDAELMAFVKTGRPIWDPENTTGVDMPAKGGNPALSDEALAEIVKYIRSLHGK